MTPSDLSILYNTYAARLTFFAINIVKDKEAAGDVVSKVFTKIWESGEPVDGFHRNGLYERVRNGCIDYLRSKKVRSKREVTADEFEDIPDTDETDRCAMWSEYLDTIWEEVKHLPERQREIFIRTYVGGQKAPQIAKEMGITASTVTTQRSRGIQYLRNKIKPV